MNDELQALEKTHTWIYVDLPLDKRSIGCKWIYKIKAHSNGTIEHYKTHLVAKGYSQEYGIDYKETFAHMDVKNVFLNGTLSEEVYMKPPPNTSPPHKTGISYQAKYASDLLVRSRITNSNTASTPLDPNVHLTPYDGVPLEDFMAIPRTIHFTVVLRILRYIKGTLGHGLQFSSQSSLILSGYSDADWAGGPIDRRSTTGYCFYLVDSLISWRSKKQSVVSRSSTKSEYCTLADATVELIWLRWLLANMGVP
ncbi:putative mitochondrial protein [Cucumis melo var. makuwa]|uniref:Mitochondrial protein n=1 Tax=Cucumis melo var. makuwa TaxID=1194695 RepID=A0A5A7TTH3_CUCMM|nr:putative mitochondrial protein [Cucumis melo var. makuwa]TYK14509.1 putative mitochondrial protein [Cucumis melo var. makuwa]